MILALFFLVGAAGTLLGLFFTHPNFLRVPAWSAVKPHLTHFGIWAGTCAGVLTIIDWLTPANAKKSISNLMVSAWAWLGQQQAGKFKILLFNQRFQRVFAVLAHITIAWIVLAFLGQRLGYFKGISVSLEIGHPRLYPFQVWVDALAILISSWLFGWRVYPRIAFWIASSSTLGQYFKRALGSYGCCWLLTFFVLIMQSPIFFVMFAHSNFANPEAEARGIEIALHGRVVVTVIHAITALISAPVLAGLLMLQTVVFCSVYWLILVMLVMLVFRCVQYFIERVVAGNQGPILALSGLLVAISVVLKYLT